MNRAKGEGMGSVSLLLTSLLHLSHLSQPCILATSVPLGLRSSRYASSLILHPLRGPLRGEDESVESERREGTELDHESGAFRILLTPAFLSQLFL